MVDILRTFWHQLFCLPERFAPSSLELRFLLERTQRLAVPRRLSGTLGILIWTGHVFTERQLIAMDPSFATSGHEILHIRVLSALWASVPLLLGFRKQIELSPIYSDAMVIASSIPIFGGSIIMMLKAPHPYDAIYYFPGIVVVMIYFFGMFRLLASRVLVLLISSVSVCQFLLWYRVFNVNGTSELLEIKALIAAILSTTVFILGYVISVQLERAERLAFASKQQLNNSNEELTKRSLQIEAMNAQMATLMRESLENAEARLFAEEKHRKEVERRNRDKSKFLALSVHDLKQPIQAIGNALFTADRSFRSGNQRMTSDSLALARNAAEQMRKQLGAILDISRLESGATPVNLESVDILEAIAPTITQLKLTASESNVSLRMTSASQGSIHVLTDRTFIERIVQNLAGNAIKYRRRDSEQASVVISIEVQGGFAILRVEDNGRGIAEEHIASGAIFEPFFQVDNQFSEQRKGVGLGLTLVRGMIQMLPEHDLKVTSSIGQGSVFKVMLPLCQASDAPKSSTDTSVAADVVLPSVDWSNLYIWLVEDDPLVNASTCHLLVSLGARYETFASYLELSSQVDCLERNPDLLICDYRLPGGYTSVDVDQCIRVHFGPVPLIVLSGELGELPGVTRTNNSLLLRKPLAPNELLRAMSFFAGRIAGADSQPLQRAS